jgi:G6PDH family F420-dependent oxidoreductase
VAKFGYTLSSEEFPPSRLVELACRAEELGFDFAMISDHYHPWLEAQGESPFVWSVLGAIAARTERLKIGTGVTCPTIRIHPAIISQAAATTAALLPGRFWLGLGTGENLNEHILGGRWPSTSVRREMLEEAVAVIRELFTGEQVEHRGRHYTVENARLYSLPDELPPILVAGSGPKAAQLAGQIGDGYIGLAPDSDLIESFTSAGGAGKPTLAQLQVCWAEDEHEARQTALRQWSNAGLGGELSQELPTPAHFQQAVGTVREEDVCGTIPCGPDIDRFVESAQQYLDAGYDHLYFHQIGDDQEGFFAFAERELLPRLSEIHNPRPQAAQSADRRS